MNKKILVSVVVTAILLVSLIVPAFAEGLIQNPNNWKVWAKVELPNGRVLLKTRHPDLTSGGGLTFPLFNESQGYTSYLKRNYNKDLTGKTISAAVLVNGNADYASLGCAGAGAASVRLYFTSHERNFTENDYWFSQETTLEAAEDTVVTLNGNTATPGDWVNLNGDSATANPDAFAAALKSVNQLGLFFVGAGCRPFSSGVTVTSGTASFELQRYEVD